MLILPQLPEDFNPDNVGITATVVVKNVEKTGYIFDHCNYIYCSRCRKKYSMKADTPVFMHSNLTFKQIFILVFCWQKQFGIGETRYSTGLSYPSIRKWFTRLRTALTHSEYMLDSEVEVDGSYIGRRKARQHLVAGLLEVGTNRLVL